jgi:hypothetical protein
MKTIKTFIVLFIIVPISYSQEIDSIFESETSKLLLDIMHSLGGEFNYDLDRKPYDWINESCNNIYRSSEFSELEDLITEEQLKNPKIKFWTNAFFKDGLIIDEEEWMKGIQKSNRLFIRFSSPIFKREYSVCIITYHCGFWGAGFGATAIYKKEDGKWSQFGANCSWDN